jgi:hypothetical protein
MASFVKRLYSKVAAGRGSLCHMLRNKILAQFMIKFTVVAQFLRAKVVKLLLYISFPLSPKFEALQTNWTAS